MQDVTGGAKPPEERKPGWIERIGGGRLIGALVSVAAFLWFAVDNSQEVKIDWWVADVHARMIYVIITAFALGFVTARLLARRKRRKDD
jgi:uncharacterized integral membrane protein